ncbi:MAG: hypothetical protein V4603_11960 [Pseudomonadota bacterium]
MKTNVLLISMIASMLLSGCSEPTIPPAPTPSPTPSAAAAPAPTEIKREQQGVLTDTQRAGYNAANQASDVLKKAEEERRKQMEAQGI